MKDDILARAAKLVRQLFSFNPPHTSMKGSNMNQKKIFLSEQDIPKQWYNIAADMPSPPPPILHPGTGQPIGPDDLSPLFPMGLIILSPGIILSPRVYYRLQKTIGFYKVFQGFPMMSHYIIALGII